MTWTLRHSSVSVLLFLATTMLPRLLNAEQTCEDSTTLLQTTAKRHELPQAVPPIEEQLSSPSVLPRSLLRSYSEEKTSSQIGQDVWADGMLGKMKDGFAIESGAFDGETHSNSIFFELFRNWQCLLVEPDPHAQETLMSKNRKCHVLKGGLSFTDQPRTFKFKKAVELGGIAETMGEDQQSRIRKEIAEGKNMVSDPEAGGEIDIPAYPLNMVMEKLNRKTIDYWSLDVEGSELAILRNTDFKTLEIGLITVEHNGKQEPIRSLLESNGFVRVQSGSQDDYYANPSYFSKRGLTLHH